MKHPTTGTPRTAWLAVLVAALGYFVDIYDLILFGVIRESSLLGIGIPKEELSVKGHLLLDIQMVGLLVGGIVWGVLGDKKGRLSVLFGSILLYSLANLANGFAYDLTSYAVLRFVAGVGLAGELGAGVTLVSELMPPKMRGIGATIIASFGALGAVVASLTGGYDWGQAEDNWRVAYWIGGGMGIVLLLLRIGVTESGMFRNVEQSSHRRGDVLALFRNRELFFRYLRCILIGVPIWYAIGILVFFVTDFAPEIGLVGDEKLVTGKAIMFAYFGLSAGDIASGLISQLLRSRKKVVLLFIVFTAAAVAYYLTMKDVTVTHVYWVCFLLGCTAGYWAIFVTGASEQFGTNLRATVTTSVPNFVRGSLVLVSLSYNLLLEPTGSHTVAAALVGGVTIVIALLVLMPMRETFGRDLNFVEKI